MVKILSPWLTLVASFLETPHLQKSLHRGCIGGVSSIQFYFGFFEFFNFATPFKSGNKI